MKQKSLLALASALLIISSLHFLVYATVRMEQNHRFDEAPLQKATEVAYALHQGADAKALFPAQDPQLFTSELLSTFVLDSQGAVIAANTRVADRAIPIPGGLLAYAKKLRLKKVTWHPWHGLRKALVIRYVRERNCYVAVAGPYNDTPDRNLLFLLAASWTFCFFMLLLYALLSRRYQRVSQNR
jgi:hypothetical protein